MKWYSCSTDATRKKKIEKQSPKERIKKKVPVGTPTCPKRSIIFVTKGSFKNQHPSPCLCSFYTNIYIICTILTCTTKFIILIKNITFSKHIKKE